MFFIFDPLPKTKKMYGPSTASPLSTVAQTLMQIYEILSEDYGQLVVQIFLSRITVVCQGAQWLSGRVLDSRQRGCRFKPHRHHCVVVLEQDTFILA